MSNSVAVNEHYLNHVVALSESSEVQASEDIVSGTGQKLVAKGARIDARVRERLLEHKLSKPLESVMQVVDGSAAPRLEGVATALLARHPLLADLCRDARLHAPLMHRLIASPQLDSLLSVYAAQAEGKLEHAVGVALLAAALVDDASASRTLAPTLLLAGLMHDVGELYIDPTLLRAGQRLTAAQWKHIASHPVVGARVLKDVPGANAHVAQCVRHHHERLDGFGYPQGLKVDSLPATSQALAAAEMLVGLMESGSHHAERAAVAMRLVPGEFNRRLLDRVVTAARGAQTDAPEADVTHIEELAGRLATLTTTLVNFREVRRRVESEQASYGKEMRALLEHALARGERIRVALASTGLESCSPQESLRRLQTMDAATRLEVTLVVRELQWRMGELERQVSIRSEPLAAAEAARVQALIALTKA